jgi:SAM-dependent methyltransferase
VIYRSINKPVLDSIPLTAIRVLDIGCGAGDLGFAIKKRQKCFVTGITFSGKEADMAKNLLDKVFIANLNAYEVRSLGRFDCIVCCHVLEHLTHPEQLLSALARDCLTPDGFLIVALPNVLYWKSRLQFLCGRFRYTEGGIMDRTHVRFYDWTSAFELLDSSGLTVVKRKSEGLLPMSRMMGPLGGPMNRAALSLFPGLFGWQFVLCGQKIKNDRI